MILPYSTPDDLRALSVGSARCAQRAHYALLRQQRAVQRVLLARDAQEAAVAARWARAWHRLVQRRLATTMTSTSSARSAPRSPHDTTRHRLH